MPLGKTAPRFQRGAKMQKAKLHIEPIEQEYINKYKERTDTTYIKLQEQHVPKDIMEELVQLRMDNIFLRQQLEQKKKILTDIGMNPFAVTKTLT